MARKQPCHESNVGDANLFNKLYRCFNPQISPQSINTLVHTHKKVVRIKEVITKEKVSWILNEFSKLVIATGNI